VLTLGVNLGHLLELPLLKALVDLHGLLVVLRVLRVQLVDHPCGLRSQLHQSLGSALSVHERIDSLAELGSDLSLPCEILYLLTLLLDQVDGLRVFSHVVEIQEIVSQVVTLIDSKLLLHGLHDLVLGHSGFLSV